jgi:hypothetical protein
MPTPEAPSRVTGRCTVHPGSVAVAVCDGCGRRMCLSCAIPVRGGTVGNECLATVLGPDAPPGPAVDRRAPGDVAFLVAGAGFAACAATTIVPWTNSLTSSHVRGYFGAWETSPLSWALLAAAASALGLAGWLLVRFRPSLRSAPSLWLLALVAATAVVGAVLFLIDPPFATHPFLGPWLTAVAGTVTASACVSAAVKWASGHGTAASRR